MSCVDLEDHVSDGEKYRVQEKEEQKWHELLNSEADHPDQEAEVVTEPHKREGLRESLYERDQVEGEFEHVAIMFPLHKDQNGGVHEHKRLGKVDEIPEVKEIVGSTQLIELAHLDSHETEQTSDADATTDFRHDLVSDKEGHELRQDETEDVES